MSGLLDMLSGIYRYFPNTMTVGLIVLGLALGRVSWILVAIGGLLLSLGVSTLQIIFGEFELLRTEQTPGLREACSTLPIMCNYSMMPSMWFALTSYYISYIMSNAIAIYTAKPTKQPNTAISVQQRKGLGVISVVAVLVVGLLLLVARALSPCESWLGLVLGLLMGGGLGYGWWYMLNGTGQDIFQDIHGVMIGLQPGDLRTGPLACTPA